MKKVILIILQLETDYFSSLSISEKCYSKKEPFYSLPRLPDIPFTWRESADFFKLYRSSSAERKGILLHSFIQQVHICVCFQSLQSYSSHSRHPQCSTPFQHPPSRMHILQFFQTSWFPENSKWVLVELQTILQTFNLQRKGNVVISAISNSFEIMNMLTTIHSFSSKHEWLINNSVYEFPIDTIPSSYVWIMLATLEWPSQVTDLLAMNISVKSNSHVFLWTINSVTSESYLITSLVYSFCSDICINTIVIPMYIQFKLIPLVQHVTTSTRKKFFKCTYICTSSFVLFQNYQYSLNSINILTGCNLLCGKKLNYVWGWKERNLTWGVPHNEVNVEVTYGECQEFSEIS